MSKDNKKQFILTGEDKKAQAISPDALERHDEVVPGFYNVKIGMFGPTARKTEDITLPVGAELTAKMILDVKEMKDLFSPRSLEIHAELGAKAKVGYLLEGPHGTGKTTAALASAKHLIDTMGACAFIVDSSDGLEGAYDMIKEFRTVTPDMLAVVIFDECETAMQAQESNMKRLLDGAETPTNFVFIGATNYIDRVPEAIKNRPSRIKHLFECKDLLEDEAIVWTMLNNMNTNVNEKYRLTSEAVKEFTPKLVGKTIDEIKHVFLDALLSAPIKKEVPKPKIKKKTGTPACEELN